MIPALFRGSLWLAALAAGGAVLAPNDLSVWLWAAAGAASVCGWWLWRNKQEEPPQTYPPQTDSSTTLPMALRIDGAALQSVTLRIRQIASSASSLDAALHEAAGILRSELGAIEARAYRIDAQAASVDAQVMPRLIELVATRSGVRPAGQLPAVKGSVLVQAIRNQRAVLALPDAAALPIVRGDAVIAALELANIAVAVDENALRELMTLTATTLAEIASRDEAVAPGTGHADAVDDSQFQPPTVDALLHSTPLRQGPSPTMPNRGSHRDAPAANPADAASGSGGTTGATALDATALDATALDATALARLAELDPDGASRLLPRVLTAYLNSIARLHPQFVAARPAHDLAAIRHVTHTLKSSSASIGAIKLAAICAEIDAMIRTANTADLDKHLDAMDAELERVLKAVKHLLGSYP